MKERTNKVVNFSPVCESNRLNPSVAHTVGSRSEVSYGILLRQYSANDVAFSDATQRYGRTVDKITEIRGQKPELKLRISE